MGGTRTWRKDAGYAYLTEEKHTGQFEVFASYDVISVREALKLSLGPSYHRLHEGTSELSVTQHALQLDLVIRNRLLSFLSPHARAAIGWVATRAWFDLDILQDTATAVDHSYLLSLGGGLTLHTPERLFETRRGNLASLSFGLLAEGGYHLSPDASLRQKTGAHNGIKRAALDFGELERKGPYLRFWFVTRF